MTRSGFRCAACGKWHTRAPTDFAFQLPDDVWAIKGKELERRAKFNTDVCILDGQRRFIRGVLRVPFAERGGFFGWGLWVEVARKDFARYLALFDADGSEELPFPGAIANRLKGYPGAYRKPVEVQLGPRTQRPTFAFGGAARHLLSAEQRRGITVARYHEILHTHMPSLSGGAARS